jgi:hypothetical protein
MKKIMLALIALTLTAAAQAKLPPLSDDAKAAAAAAKDKAAWADKVAAFQLCQVQDRVAAQYAKTKNMAKKTQADFPPCANPGPYVPAQAAAQAGVADAKPVPAAGKPQQAQATKK